MALKFLNNGYFAGSVGIGTQSPIGKLEVQSSVVRTSVNGGADELVLQNAGYSGMTILSSNTTAAQIHFGDDAMSNTGMIQYWNNTNSMAFSTNGGSERMRIDMDGNVGIGTNSPDAKLTISASNSGAANNNTLRFVDTDVTTQANQSFGKIEFETKDTNNPGVNAFINAFAEGTGGTGALSFGTGSGGSTERMRITSAGNVGIGTTSPLQPFQVDAGSNIASFRSVGTGENNKELLIQTGGDRVTLDAKNADDGTATSLAFELGNSEKARLTPTGLGIGTTSPSNKLHVEGNVNGAVQIEVDNQSTGNASYAGLFLNGQGNNFFLKNWGDQVPSFANITEFVSTAGSSSFVFSPDSSEKMRITSTGNVGIGTTSPTQLLHVSSTTSNPTGIGLQNSQRYYSVRSNNYSLVFTDETVGSERMRINSSGNVGIGTTSPSEKLEVEGNIKLSSVGTGNSASSYEMLFYGTTSSGTQTDQAKIHSSPWISNSNGGNLQLYTSNASNVLTERMRIDGAGNVGIGTASPSAKLDVAGTGNFTGLVSGITPVNAANFVTKAYVDGSGGGTGPFLPLAGGTLTGGLTGTTANFVGTIRSTLASDNSYYSLFSNNGSLVLDTAGVNSGMQFKILGSTKLTMLNSGNVGIGTTSPGAKLEINGVTRISGDLAGTGQNPLIQLYNTDTSLGANQILGDIDFYQSDPSGGGAGVVGRIRSINDSSFKGEASLTFSTGEVGVSFQEQMRITSTGNVGIGTTSPGAKLHTKTGSSNGAGYDNSVGLIVEGATRSIIQVNSTSDAYLMFGDAAQLNRAWVGYNHTTDQLMLHTGSTITMDGNVGIGTTGPIYKLDVVSAGDGLLSLTGATKPAMIFKVGTAVVGGIQAQTNTSLNVSAYGTSSLNLQTAGTAPRLTILTGGNVGIGTITPAAELHIMSGSASYPVDANNHLVVESSSHSYIGLGGGVGSDVGIHFGDSGSSGAGRIAYKNSDNSMRFRTAGSGDHLVINSLGNVGIGTTAPAAKLHVKEPSGSTSQIKMSASSNEANYGYLTMTDNTVNTAKLTFGTTYGYNTPVPAMTVWNGMIGIGTTNPTQKLHLNNSATLTPTYQKFTNGTATTGTTLGIDADGDFIINNGEAKEIKLYTNDSQRVTIQSGGNVGIGTTSPETPLHVLTNTTDNASTMLIQNGSTGDASIKFNISGDTYSIGIDNSDSDKFKLSYGAVGTNDRIVVDTSGNVGIGTTSPGSLLEIEGATNSSTSNLLRLSRASQGSTPEKVAGFYSGTSGEKGYITVNNFGTAYNTSSDYRLKENIKPIEDSVERLMSLKPCNFNFISEEEDKIVMDGFIAHEAKEVVPEAVTGIKDAVDEKGNPMYQGIDQSKIVPLLTAALQQALQRIEILEQKLNN